MKAFKKCKISLVIAATMISVVSQAQDHTFTGDGTSTGNVTVDPKFYLDRAIALFRASHINSSKMDWNALIEQAHSASKNAANTSDTYPAIWTIIKALGEKHTFFITPDQAKAQSTGMTSKNVEPPPLLLPEAVRLSQQAGLIRLYGFSGSTDEASRYAAFGKAKIETLKAQGVCKFVVDLRANTGGNMYPMIEAVGGVLGDGVLGTFVNTSGSASSWVLKDGKAGISAPVASTPKPASPDENVDPVAVLIGTSTSSAGEFTAMSFKGRANTRFFGAPSSGFVTANEPMPLPDGAVILMTVGWGVDRTGKKHTDRLVPDETTGAGGPALDAAMEWIGPKRCP